MHSLPCRSIGRRPVAGTKHSIRGRLSVTAAKTGVQIPDTYKTVDLQNSAGREAVVQVAPKGDMVFLKCAPEEVKTTGGILLPGSAMRRPTSGTVVTLGDGRVQKEDKHIFTLSKGDCVIYSKFGFAFTELVMGEDEYLLIQEDEVIGIVPPDPTADDIPMLKPLNDRVLIKVDGMSDVTSGGVMLPETAKEKPLSGVVIRTGPGKRDEDNKLQKPKVKAGDKVLYFKYAGEKMETRDGTEYVVLRENDILCKA